MDIIETINTGNVISIGYAKECEEYLFSILDNLFNISYVDYKNQSFQRDDFIINDDSYIRDTKISLLMSNEHDKGYNIINLNNFVSNPSSLNKSKEVTNLIRSISSQGYMWSNQNIKIRTIFISYAYPSISEEIVMRGGNTGIYLSDLVLMVSEIGKFTISKNTNSPCTIKNIVDKYPISDSDLEFKASYINNPKI